MSLLLPTALLGLLALPLILLLHLLRDRRRRRYVSSLRLWRGLQRKRRGSLPRSIPLSWMLLLQLLVAAALSLALARPVLTHAPEPPRQTIFVLDTTTSMAASAAPGAASRFDVARDLIRAHLERLGETDTVAVIGLNPRPAALFSGTGREKALALGALADLRPGATGLDLPAALTLANGLVDPERQSRIVLLSDGNLIPAPEALPPARAPLEWRLVSSTGRETGPAGLPNQALLNVSARTLPDGGQRLFARVLNYAELATVRTVRVLADGRLYDERPLSLPAQGEVTRVWTLPAGTETATVQILEPDALTLDNRAELALTGVARRRVLLVSDAPDLLARAFQAQPGVALTVVDRASWLGDGAEVDGVEIDGAGFDLTVLDDPPLELVASLAPAGDLLVVNPPLGHPLLPAQNYVRDLRPDPATASALLDGIDLSGVYWSRAPRVTLPAWAEVDLRAANEPQGLPLVFHGTVGESRLLVWAFDLAETNLPARLALPLLTANTLAHFSRSSFSVLRVGEPVALEGGWRVELPDGGLRTLAAADPDGGEAIFTRTQQPGLYHVYDERDVLVARLAVHAGSALESNLGAPSDPRGLATPSDPQDPGAAVPPSPPAPEPDTMQRDLWPWLAALVLVVVTVEGWLAWQR